MAETYKAGEWVVVSRNGRYRTVHQLAADCDSGVVDLYRYNYRVEGRASAEQIAEHHAEIAERDERARKEREFRESPEGVAANSILNCTAEYLVEKLGKDVIEIAARLGLL